MDGLTAEESDIVAVVSEFVEREVRPVVRELEHANASSSLSTAWVTALILW